MWLLLLLIRSLMLFSFISISSCALSANKETTLSNNGKLSLEGSGSIPANEVFSDDEDFTPNLMKPSHSSMLDFSGDGSLDHYTDQEQGPGLITHGHGHPKPTDTFSHSDDEDEGTNDDDDDEDDDEGSGDSEEAKSTDSFSTKETIIDDDHPKITDTIHPKPDISIIHPDESEDRATITGDDDDDKSSDNSFPNVIETSTKQYKPNHDPDHEDHDQDENTSRNDISILGHKQDTRPVSFFAQPSMLAAVIGGTVVSLLCAILLAMFIIYRTRRKDEASYICEPNLTSPVISHYGKGSSNKFFDP